MGQIAPRPFCGDAVGIRRWAVAPAAKEMAVDLRNDTPDIPYLPSVD